MCLANNVYSSAGLGTRLFICNNDESIKVFEIPTMRRICELKMPFAVNNVKVSPDGKKMIVVGDSSQVKKVVTAIASLLGTFI